VLRLRLRNFRGVADREVAFAEHGVTIVEGDNETGKSSLVEALDLLLDKFDSSQDRAVKAVCPTNVDAGPEVEADLVCGEFHFTYRKRWYRERGTTLSITAPTREQLVGREAHERVRSIIGETVDDALWRALRVTQTQPLGQTSLAGSVTLSQALDLAASGGSVAAGDENAQADLAALARREYESYFTPKTGRPTGEYRQVIDALDEARESLATAEARVRAAEDDAAAANRLDNELAELTARRDAHRPRLRELEAEHHELEQREAATKELQQLVLVASLRLDEARGEQEARAELARDLAAQQAEHARLTDSAATNAEELARARDDAARAARARDELEAQVRAAEAAAAGARADVDAVADRLRLGELTERQSRVERLAEAIATRERQVAAFRVDEDSLAELTRRHEDALRAEAAVAALAATVRVSALGEPVELRLDDAPLVLRAETPVERRVTAPLRLTVSDTLCVEVVPGSGDEDVARRLATARGELAAACAAADVADIADARRRLDARRDAERELRLLREELSRELSAGGAHDASSVAAASVLGELRAARDEIAERVAADERERAADEPRPEDIETARRWQREKEDELAERRARLAEVAADAERARHALTELDVADQVAAQRLRDLSTLLTEARERIAAREAKESSASLAERVVAAERAHATARERWQLAADELAAANPDRLAALLAAERASGARVEREIEEARIARVAVLARLAEGGAQEALDAAHSRVVELTRRHEELRRLADAAALLHTTLERHRETARRAYVAPFRERLERLGRIVFGQDLALEIDDELRVVSRTLRGVTVPYDGLSGGAKEQLGVCARLACAELVGATGGVPVMIDDALGYTDPERLRALSAVFSVADPNSQVIVLTCTPERYRGVGTATVVRLRD
jgi:DNA repair exonuclease SbcCD ATPase subunit